MQMEEGLDTGPVLVSESIPIHHHINAAELHDRLADLGGRLILSALKKMEEGSLHPVIQDENAAIYAAKIRKEEAGLDFSFPATENHQQNTGLQSFSGLHGKISGYPAQNLESRSQRSLACCRKSRSDRLSADENGIVVACGKGSIRILELQKPGAKRLPVSEFIKGFSFEHGYFE